jgi:hypothetical protein
MLAVSVKASIRVFSKNFILNIRAKILGRYNRIEIFKIKL